jgi:hypothetical protein
MVTHKASNNQQCVLKTKKAGEGMLEGGRQSLLFIEDLFRGSQNYTRKQQSYH